MNDQDLQKRFTKITDEAMGGETLLNMGIRDRMQLMAKVGRAIMREGISPFFMAAIVTAHDVVFPATVIGDDKHKDAVERGIVELANKLNAQCVIFVTEAWGAKTTAADADRGLRPSLDPRRKEFLVVVAKDFFTHLYGMQRINRTKKGIEFEELEITPTSSSWLDQWEVKPAATTSC